MFRPWKAGERAAKPQYTGGSNVVYYNAAPQISRIENRLELAIYEALSRKRSRRSELRRKPDSPGQTPEAAEADALREAIREAIFALRMLHN